MRVSGSAPASYLLRLESLIRGRRIITPVGRTNARQRSKLSKNSTVVRSGRRSDCTVSR
jgi:hypothetical protein